MNVKEFIHDDDKGVSPVIGVILMVAITVILAAVIASFVIGLGDNNQNTGPTTSINFDYDAGDGELEIRVTGGENLDPTQVEVQGDSDGGDTIGQNWDSFTSGQLGGPTAELQAGSTLTIDVGSAYDVSVVYVNPNTQESFTLNEDEGPDA